VDHYDIVPQLVAEKILANAKRPVGEEEEEEEWPSPPSRQQTNFVTHSF